jgi:hypothetical protein
MATENTKIEVKGNILTVTIDLTKKLGRSKSGKSEIIATTGGNISVPNHPEIKLGLNCYK